MKTMSQVGTILRSPRRRAVLLAGLVVSALAIGATLTFEAWRASRDHRRAVNRALSGYAEFAVSAYRQQLLGQLYVASSAIFRPLGNTRMTHAEGAMPDPSVLVAGARDAARCDCGPFMRPRYFFRLDARDGSVVIAGEGVSPATHARVSRLVSDLGDFRERRDWDYVAFYDSTAATPQLLYVTPWRGPDGLARAVYGFAVDLESVRESFLSPIFANTRLLPIDPRRIPNDSLISLSVTDSVGGLLVRASSHSFPSTFSATLPAGGMMGSLRLQLALNPLAAPAVLVGGLPPSRGPLLLGLLALVAAVIAALCVVAWRAAELARLRTEFVAAVSHELRTPLAQILLFGDSLRLGRIRARGDVENAGDVIVGESRRLIQLVENVLLFGRITRGGAERVASEPAALAPLVRDVVDAFGPQAQSAEVRVRLVRADDVTVRADLNGIRQVLLNLLDNATKYGPVGQTIAVGLAHDGDAARLWVEDEGPGIPEADRARVWEPFTRLGRDIEANVAGSGIGLSVVRDIVRRHGGTARVEATPSGSARVVIELPGARAGNVPGGQPMSACAS